MPAPHPVLVWDSGPLIALAGAGVLELALQLPGTFLVPDEVRQEVVEGGRKRGSADAARVEKALSEGKLGVGKVASAGRAARARLQGNPRLSAADIAALALAVDRGGRLIADERDLRRAAAVLGVPPEGSLYVLRWMIEERLLTRQEATEAVDRMMATGWYCSPAVLKGFLDSLPLGRP